MDALFYPNLSLPGAAWTNPNLLFFDTIGVIAPDADPRELFDGPTRVLMDQGLVRSVRPRGYAENDEDDALVLSHLLGMMQQRRRRDELTRIHLGKIAYTSLPSALRDLRLLWPSHRQDWLEGPVWVIDYLMTVLATRMAIHPDLDFSLVTNRQSTERLVAGVPRGEQAQWSRRMRAVARLLPIGPDAELAEIVRFRRSHSVELKAFRGLIEALIRRSPQGSNGESDFEARLREAERLRQHLERELEEVRTLAPALPIFLSISAIVAPTVEASYFSAAAAVGGLGYLLYTRGATARRQRAARADQLVYAAIAAKTFAARSAEEVLR